MLLWVMDGCVQEFCYKKCYSRESNQLLGIVFLNHLAPFGKSRCIYLCFVPSIFFFVGDQFSRKSGPFKSGVKEEILYLEMIIVHGNPPPSFLGGITHMLGV